MTPQHSCIWMGEEKAIVFTLQAFLSSIPPNPLRGIKDWVYLK